MPNQGTQSGGFHRKAWTPAQCVFQQRFCHRTAANIADANDEYVSERPYLGGNCHSTSVADKKGTVTLTMTGLPPPQYLGAKEFAGELALRNNNILLAPFLGVSPGRYRDFFLMQKRKDDEGTPIGWNRPASGHRQQSAFAPAVSPDSPQQGLFCHQSIRSSQVGDLRIITPPFVPCEPSSSGASGGRSRPCE